MIAALGCNTQSQPENEQAKQPDVTQATDKQDYEVGDQVPNELVCMVNDAYMGKPQIAVPVNGKTYYGCCQMCKAKLESVQEIREGRDPVSGVIVDKASAVIGAGPDWTAYYFENEEKNMDNPIRIKIH